MKPALIGIYLGLSLSAILLLFFGVIVLSAHPVDWAAQWWGRAMLLSGAWLVLIGIGRVTRGYRLQMVGSFVVFLVFGLFIGYHFAAIVLVCSWLCGDMGPREVLPAAGPLTQGQKAVLRAAAGLSVAFIATASVVSYAHALDPLKEAGELITQVPAEVVELDPELKTDPDKIKAYLDHPQRYRDAVIYYAEEDWENYDIYGGKRPEAVRPSAAQWREYASRNDLECDPLLQGRRAAYEAGETRS